LPDTRVPREGAWLPRGGCLLAPGTAGAHGTAPVPRVRVRGPVGWGLAEVYRRLVDVPGEIDLVDVFRRPQDIDQHVDDLIAKKPKAVWFQLGITNDRAAMLLAAAGIKVVQDRCLMVDHRRYA